ncbi:hypothetical protein DPMN_160338 [Dreissena polymorpha]|uniref:Uncharacterized protein n=1 Tax=Dreissena polymorpha TaxID=45954 RepID=A0A9D4EML5_DREPO|nr:hypothetical protein DPMN_160338 [Dreissena polymorpha]
MKRSITYTLMSLSTIHAVGNATAFTLSDEEDHYTCIDISRKHSSPSQIIGGTNARDKICVKTHTAHTVAYDFLDRTGNLAEEQ